VIYWDTSAVAKLYFNESDSQAWQEYALSSATARVSSVLMEVEFAFAANMKQYRGELVPGGARKLIELLHDDIQAGHFQVFPLGADIITHALEMASSLTPHIPLRTLDGLHLATAMLLHCREIATADERLQRAAQHLGLVAAMP
jgi:predicted nucleic acid-binding protein